MKIKKPSDLIPVAAVAGVTGVSSLPITREYWEGILYDARMFSEIWAKEIAAYGWTEEEILDVRLGKNNLPIIGGLAPLIERSEVILVTEDRVIVLMTGGHYTRTILRLNNADGKTVWMSWKIIHYGSFQREFRNGGLSRPRKNSPEDQKNSQNH